MLVVLAVVVGVVWVTVLQQSAADSATRCNPPPTRDNGQVLKSNALDSVPPAPLASVKLRVLNGSGQRGQAGLVTLALQQVGFTRTAPAANDPRYPDQNLRCRGQLRFGAAGVRAARTLSLALPCLQLVRDGRQDATVDVAVGTLFTEVRPNADARAVLARLSASPGGDTGSGGEQAQPARDGPALNPELLAGARDVHCG